MPTRIFHGAVFAAGFAAMVTQMVLLREVLHLAGGNELSLGLVLGTWMLLMGWGAWIGGRLSARWRGWGLVVGLAAMAALPLPTLGGLRAGWAGFVGRGVAAGMSEIAGAALLAFAQYCLVAGAFLALAARAGPDGTEEPMAGRLGKIYALDCFGGVLGGAVFTFVVVRFLGPVHLLGALGLVLGAVAAALGRGLVGRRLGSLPGVVATLVTIPCVAVLSPGPNEARERHDTPYGVVEVETRGGQVAFFVDGRPLSISGNVEQVEEAVHPVLAQRPHAAKVLLVGGVASGMVAEILRYPVQRLDCIELDPSVVEAARRHGILAGDNARMRVLVGDGREVVRRARGEYDVIFVEVPDPSSFQWNRYFTLDFFREANAAMRKEGILSVAAGEYANYVSPELAGIIATISSDLGVAFGHSVVLPTGRIRHLGSCGPLSADVAANVAATGLPMRHLNPAGLRAVFSLERNAQVQGARALDQPANLDFHPVLCQRFFMDWLKRFRPEPGGVALAALVALLAGVAVVRRHAFPVLVAGYAGATCQVLVLVGFQILFGSVYGKVGWLTAVFFAGLGLGAGVGVRMRGATARVALLALGGTLLALPVAFAALGGSGGLAWRWSAEWVGVPCLAFLPAFLSSSVLPLAARGRPGAGAGAGDFYHADYVGGCLGALLVSGALLPSLGFQATAFVAAGLCLFGAMVSRASA